MFSTNLHNDNDVFSFTDTDTFLPARKFFYILLDVWHLVRIVKQKFFEQEVFERKNVEIKRGHIKIRVDALCYSFTNKTRLRQIYLLGLQAISNHIPQSSL